MSVIRPIFAPLVPECMLEPFRKALRSETYRFIWDLTYFIVIFGAAISSIVYFFYYLRAFDVDTTTTVMAALFSLSFTLYARCVTRWTTADQVFHTVGIFGLLFSLHVLHNLYETQLDLAYSIKYASCTSGKREVSIPHL